MSKDIIRWMDDNIHPTIREEAIEIIISAASDYDDEEDEHSQELKEIHTALAGAVQTLHELAQGKVKLVPVT